MKTPQTPTPWRYTDDDPSTEIPTRHLYAANDALVASTGPLFHQGAPTSEEARQLAAHIVHCVNTHAALVAALEGCLRTTRAWLKDEEERNDLVGMAASQQELHRIKHALALAHGKE